MSAEPKDDCRPQVRLTKDDDVCAVAIHGGDSIMYFRSDGRLAMVAGSRTTVLFGSDNEQRKTFREIQVNRQPPTNAKH